VTEGIAKTTRQPERLTLDTCHVYDYFEHRAGEWAIQRLLELNKEGIVELAVTAHVSDELEGNHKRGSWLAQLSALGVIDVPLAFEVGRGQLDKNPLGSDEFERFYRLAVKLVRQGLHDKKRGRFPDDRDWGHLHAHLLGRRDVFLTSDEALLFLAPELQQRFQIRVMRPEDYLLARRMSRKLSLCEVSGSLLDTLFVAPDCRARLTTECVDSVVFCKYMAGGNGGNLGVGGP
jgi:hypothetical protein